MYDEGFGLRNKYYIASMNTVCRTTTLKERHHIAAKNHTLHWEKTQQIHIMQLINTSTKPTTDAMHKCCHDVISRQGRYMSAITLGFLDHKLRDNELNDENAIKKWGVPLSADKNSIGSFTTRNAKTRLSQYAHKRVLFCAFAAQ